MRKSGQKGITLVALVIIIIILLILSGITIVQLTGSGLFSKAKLAKEKQENAQIEEDATLADYENSIHSAVVGTRDQIMVDKAEYEQLVKDVESLKAQTINTNYSTTEQVVGNWINGKALYRKVIPVTITGVTPHGITNIDILVNYSLTWYDTVDNMWYDRMRLWEESYGIALEMNIGSDNIHIGSNRYNSIDWTSRTSKAYAILEYTKTTD